TRSGEAAGAARGPRAGLPAAEGERRIPPPRATEGERGGGTSRGAPRVLEEHTAADARLPLGNVRDSGPRPHLDDESPPPTKPALQVGRRRRKRVDSISMGERQRSIRAMSQDQLQDFLSAARDEPTTYLALFVLLARTGLRPGEAYALHIGDLDFNARQIRVE